MCGVLLLKGVGHGRPDGVVAHHVRLAGKTFPAVLAGLAHVGLAHAGVFGEVDRMAICGHDRKLPVLARRVAVAQGAGMWITREFGLQNLDYREAKYLANTGEHSVYWVSSLWSTPHRRVTIDVTDRTSL